MFSVHTLLYGFYSVHRYIIHLGQIFTFFNGILGRAAFDGEPFLANRYIDMYHGKVGHATQDRIIETFANNLSAARVLFSTVGFGMGATSKMLTGSSTGVWAQACCFTGRKSAEPEEQFTRNSICHTKKLGWRENYARCAWIFQCCAKIHLREEGCTNTLYFSSGHYGDGL